MKVYIVEWYSAEEYTDYSGPLKAFSTTKKAQEFIDNNQNGPYGVDLENFNDGYFVGSLIYELDVE